MKKRQIEFGDFQTPEELCEKIVVFLKSSGVNPTVVIEPTCGTGNFLFQSLLIFNNAKAFYGFDINEEYVKNIKNRLANLNGKTVEIKRQNFFQMGWEDYFHSLPENVLVIGNPPWVTNSTLGTIQSENLPPKSNFQNLKGFSAKTERQILIFRNGY